MATVERHHINLVEPFQAGRLRDLYPAAIRQLCRQSIAGQQGGLRINQPHRLPRLSCMIHTAAEQSAVSADPRVLIRENDRKAINIQARLSGTMRPCNQEGITLQAR